MAQTEPYRMLKNWSYELSANALDEDHTARTAADHPDFTDVSITMNYMFHVMGKIHYWRLVQYHFRLNELLKMTPMIPS